MYDISSHIAAGICQEPVNLPVNVLPAPGKLNEYFPPIKKRTEPVFFEDLSVFFKIPTIEIFNEKFLYES